MISLPYLFDIGSLLKVVDLGSAVHISPASPVNRAGSREARSRLIYCHEDMQTNNGEKYCLCKVTTMMTLKNS